MIARRTAVATVALAMTLLASCGVDAGPAAENGVQKGNGASRSNDGEIVGSDVGPSGSTTTTTTTTLPKVDIDVQGDDGSAANRTVANAIEDLTDWWTKEYPRVFGKPYVPIEGGYFAVDSNTSTDGLPCAPESIDDVLGNAYYCPQDDAVVWDQEGLLPDLVEKFGPLSPALVIAHEWGHSIQDRAGMPDTTPTVILEQQADCYAGSWVRHLKADDDQRFTITVDDLDRAIAGFLSLRDAPGSSADDPNAHGSGFDRVRAFQEGYQRGAPRCAEYRVGDPKPFQFEFSSQEELDNSGNLPLDGQDGILASAFDSLDAYWAQEFPKISGGKDWNPMKAPKPFDGADAPDCNGESAAGYRLFVCIPDRYVGYDATETIPAIYKDSGDFGVATLFATQYGLDVEDQLGDSPSSEVTLSLRGDCYAGAYAGAILPTDDPNGPVGGLSLSPGDLDEAVQVLLASRSDEDRKRQGPGFDRVRAFGVGVTKGAEACSRVEPS